MAQRRWAAAAVSVAALLLLSTTTTVCAGAPAAAPAPAAGMDAACLNSLLNMSDCLPYVQAGSTTARPDAACCPELAGLVGSNPVCLCELLSGAADSYGIAIDYARALALPGVCRVATPPVSTCAALGYHVRGLAPSPSPTSPGVSPSGDSPQFPGIRCPALLQILGNCVTLRISKTSKLRRNSSPSFSPEAKWLQMKQKLVWCSVMLTDIHP